MWPGNALFTETQWRPGQPNDATESDDQDCVVGTDDSHKWQDKACGTNYPFLCECEQSDVYGTYISFLFIFLVGVLKYWN